MKTKIISVVSAVAVTLSILPSMAVHAYGNGIFSLVADCDAANLGDTVVYTLSLEGTDSIRGFQAGIEYDADVLEFDEEASGFVLSDTNQFDYKYIT
ncbi:MAG: cohesin domain-containing protein, partial [Candidatus Ornithomonoglobus sp.]